MTATAMTATLTAREIIHGGGFFKHDYPRGIDRIIDYFGERMPRLLPGRRHDRKVPSARSMSKAS